MKEFSGISGIDYLVSYPGKTDGLVQRQGRAAPGPFWESLLLFLERDRASFLTLSD